MYQGASITQKDANSQTPLDLAYKLEDSATKTEILRLLTHKPDLIEILGYRSSLKKVKKSKLFPSLFFLFHVYIYSICFLFIMPRWPAYFAIAAFGLLFLTLLAWIVTMCHNPGFIKPYTKVEFLVSNSISFSHIPVQKSQN